MKKLLLLCTILLTITCVAQSDILLLKKRGVTQKTWVKGSYIKFQFINGSWVEGSIYAMKKDSLWVNMFATQRVPDQFGFPRIDTSYFGILKLHFREITAFPKPDKGGAYITSGYVLQVGGLAYMFLNIVNGIYLKEPIFNTMNLQRLGIAAGVVLVGTIISKFYRTDIPIGKRYSLEVISSPQNE
jgi:hypothetical protein